MLIAGDERGKARKKEGTHGENEKRERKQMRTWHHQGNVKQEKDPKKKKS